MASLIIGALKREEFGLSIALHNASIAMNYTNPYAFSIASRTLPDLVWPSAYRYCG
jgi:hypothetical protein